MNRAGARAVPVDIRLANGLRAPALRTMPVSFRSGGRVAALTMLAATAVSLMLAFSASPAAAHNELTGSTPAAGSTVTSAPTGVQLTFEEPLNPRFVRIAVTGPDGRSVAAGAPALSGTSVRQPLTALTSGRYVVSYRVVSQDGHPVQGTVRFTTTLPAPPASVGVAPTTAPPASAPAAAPPGAGGTRDNDPPAARKAAQTDQTGNGWWPYALAGAALLGLIGAGAVLARRRTPPRDATPSPTGPVTLP
jgi:hypothetical protein